MKDDMEMDGIDMEQLLREKSWEMLSNAERGALTKAGCDQQEYERMAGMVHQLISVTGVHDESMVPSGETRENLLLAFSQEQKKRRAMWWSGLWYRLNSGLRLDIPVVRIAFATAVLLLGVLTVVQLMNRDVPATPVANKQEKQNNPEMPLQPSAPENNGIADQTQENNSNNPANAPVVNESQDPNSNQPAPVQVNNDGQVALNPVVDTNSRTLAQTPFDSATVLGPVVTMTQLNATCCATSNGTVLTNGATNYNYNWTINANGSNVAAPTGITVTGLPPRARSLANDAQVLDVFFAMK